jgi:hypothetical protein
MLGWLLPVLANITNGSHNSDSKPFISSDTSSPAYFYLPTLKMLSPGDVTPFRLVTLFFLIAVTLTIIKHFLNGTHIFCCFSALIFLFFIIINLILVICLVFKRSEIKENTKCSQRKNITLSKVILDLMPFFIFFPSAFLWY